jgi:DNA-binding NarL/FixJ family response regulator
MTRSLSTARPRPTPRFVRDGAYLDAIMTSFADGDEKTLELAFELARRSGSSLARIYEVIQATISVALDETGPDVRRGGELDERLAWLAARMRPSVATPHDWHAYVISTHGLGRPASIAHVLTDAGIPAMVIQATALNAAITLRGRESVIPTAVKFIVLDGAHSDSELFTTTVNSLNQDGSLADSDSKYFLLGGVEPDMTRSAVHNSVPIVRVANLQDLLQRTGGPNECPLTPREQQVLGRVAAGSTNEQMATDMAVGVSTIKTYLERIHRRLDTNNRSSAVAIGIRSGWI